MKTYFPLHVHSHYSLLDGLSKPQDIVDRLIQLNLPGGALTDHGNIAGSIKFLQAMKKADKKPILGCELYVCRQNASLQTADNRKLDHLVILAKNDEGWKDLLKIIALSNNADQFYHRPRIDKTQLAEFAQNGNLIAFSGHLGSHIANCIIDDDDKLDSMWKAKAIQLTEWFKDTFGKDNFYLEVQTMDQMNNPVQKELGQLVRQVGKYTNTPLLATEDAHYASPEDAIDQRILLCRNMKVTLHQANRPEFGMKGFFKSNQFCIHSYEDMLKWNTEEELANTIQVASQIEEYNSILKPPTLPIFNCPNDISADEYLHILCQNGWNEIKNDIPKNMHSVYEDRIKQELEVLQGANLSSYFLIVSDIIHFVKSKGWLPGVGRGSAAGCLVSYLINITGIDPIKYGLIFERFYNAGRNTAERISYPDIDIDIPKYAREHVIEYIRNKYGHDKVGQMVTYQTMKGRAALKDVFRAHGSVSFDEMNEITKHIIEEHKISGELEKMKEDTGDSSIIRWCLENMGDKLKDWAYIDSQNNIQGIFAKEFEQAMRLEGTKAAQSKHPAGVVIAPEPLANICPLILDSDTKQPMVGWEMDDVEYVGIKYDILGVNLLDKTMGCVSDLATGEIYEIQ